MNDSLPPCPECASDLSYEMGALLVCPMCAHEWSPAAADETTETVDDGVVTDAFGTVLADGDTVTVLKGIKVKGFGAAIKVGTKVRNIRVVAPIDGHDIDCRVDGFGSMRLKSSLVKKA